MYTHWPSCCRVWSTLQKCTFSWHWYEIVDQALWMSRYVLALVIRRPRTRIPRLASVLAHQANTFNRPHRLYTLLYEINDYLDIGGRLLQHQRCSASRTSFNSSNIYCIYFSVIRPSSLPWVAEFFILKEEGRTEDKCVSTRTNHSQQRRIRVWHNFTRL